jgi:hypothetical protein
MKEILEGLPFFAVVVLAIVLIIVSILLAVVAWRAWP